MEKNNLAVNLIKEPFVEPVRIGLCKRPNILRKLRPAILSAILTLFSFSVLALEITSENAKYLEITKKDVVFGDRNAPNVVVEYFSLTCFHCALFYEKLYPAIKNQFIDSGKVKWVKRLFITDQRSMAGGLLLECKKQNLDDYTKFLTILLAKQEVWVTGKNYLEVLKNIAKLSGMSAEQINQCLANSENSQMLTQQTMDASKKLGMKATPSFFFNGKLITDGITLEKLDSLVSKAQTSR